MEYEVEKRTAVRVNADSIDEAIEEAGECISWNPGGSSNWIVWEVYDGAEKKVYSTEE